MAIVRLRPAELRQALASDGVSLHFQLQVHIPTESLAGVEALVRWPHPTHGMIGPPDVAALVDQGSLHAEFDGWVLREAAAQAARWAAEGIPVPVVSVNLWPQTLRQPDATRAILGAIGAGAPGVRGLELECPRAAVRDPALSPIFSALRGVGVRVATDVRAVEDLAGIAVDTVKIPPPVVADIGAQAGTIQEIVGVARERGLRLVAEGVESPEQQQALVAAGCEILQGFLYGQDFGAAEVSTLAKPPQ